MRQPRTVGWLGPGAFGDEGFCCWATVHVVNRAKSASRNVFRMGRSAIQIRHSGGNLQAAECAASSKMSCYELFETQGFDGIEPRRFARGIEAEKHAHTGGE